MTKRLIVVLAGGVSGALALSACGGGSSSGNASTAAAATSAADPASVSGKITVLSNRTDLVQDGTFKKYTAEFNKIYPKVTVTIQGITDYEGEVKIRMNTKNYGDVLLIPSTIGKADYPKFFSSLGSSTTLATKYRYTQFTTVDGKTYGLPVFGSANGFVYNKAVWKKAGITTMPTTPAEFMTDLQAIKSKTTATPYYTNYHDGWPLSSWQGAVGSATCNVQANNDLATDKTPWAAGKDLNVIDSLLYNIVKGGLVEADPSTTNWENSKALMGGGKVGTMWLASWAVTQMQAAAVKAGGKASDIGLMPFPVQSGGKFCPVSAPDYNQAVNVHSASQGAARAWIDWFTDKSGFAAAQGSIPTLKAGPMPTTLADYTKLGVNLIEMDQAKAAEVNKIDNTSEVGLTKPDYRQKIVDAARGAAGGTLQSIFDGLDTKWANGISTAGL